MGYGEAVLSYPPVALPEPRYDAQLRWHFRLLTPGQYLGLHLTLGLAAAAGCLWLFGSLVSALGSIEAVALIGVLVAALLAWKRRWL